jgi:hypothetical protein
MKSKFYFERPHVFQYVNLWMLQTDKYIDMNFPVQCSFDSMPNYHRYIIREIALLKVSSVGIIVYRISLIDSLTKL